MIVRTEKERDFGPDVAVFMGDGGVVEAVSALVSAQGVKVVWNQEVPAKYYVVFLNSEASLDRYLTLAKKFSAKLIVVFEGMSTDADLGAVATVVEIRSKIFDKQKEEEAALKIARLVFSARGGEKLIIGEFFGKNQPEVKVILPKRRPVNFGNLLWLGGVLAVIVVPFVIVILFGGIGLAELWSAKQAVNSGKFPEAEKQASLAAEKFGALKGACGGVTTFCDAFSTLELAASTVNKGAKLGEQMLTISRAFFSTDGPAPDLVGFAGSARMESQQLEENLGFLEAAIESDYGFFVSIAEKLGFPKARVDSYLSEIEQFRKLAQTMSEVAPAVPEILGGEKKTYLVVFQNSAELRGGGGFIGSYGIIHVDSGRLLDFKINDIYSSDGQLKGRVPPPDEILHYLGQPSWFMRDANFSPDFPLSAKRLAWFLEKETGQRVDGVIGVNVAAVEKILEATGPVTIASSKQPITAANFFQKAEYASEINFFPGSTQKRDFLGEVTEAVLTRIVDQQNLEYGKLTKMLTEALFEKDVMFYFNSGTAQSAMESAGLSGSIVSEGCLFGKSCLMMVEDNFGANKANYFIKKKMTVESVIDKGGGVTNTVRLDFDNRSPNDSWPGGRYKNYLRVLVPLQAKFLGISLGDERKATVSSILTADILAKVAPSQFLVVTKDEQVLTTREASPAGYKSFGVLVEIPVKTKKVVTFKYSLDKQLDFKKLSDRFRLTIIKQSGSEFNPLTVKIGFPVFLTAEKGPIVKPQEVIYNTVLDRDKIFEIKFTQSYAKD